MLIVLRPGPKVFFQYELRFVNRLKSQLLISHLFFPSKKWRPAGKKEQEIKPPFGRYPRLFGFSDQFLFQYERPQRPNRGAFWFHAGSEVPGIFEWPPRLSRRVYEGPLLAALLGSGAVSDLGQWRPGKASGPLRQNQNLLACTDDNAISR
jgi:hypothetical protein